MRYLVADDEKPALTYLVDIIQEVDPDGEIVATSVPTKALDQALESDFDAIFLDIHMGASDGISIAQMIKDKKPQTNFIFTTGFSNHMAEAFGVDACDYLMKPITVEQVSHALQNMRYRQAKYRGEVEDGRIAFHCFGNFEMIVDGKPVQFLLQKTKEVVAYMVHRQGASCTNNEILAALWEDDGHESYLRKIRKDLMDTLKSVNADYIVFLSRGFMGIQNLEEVDCDYFRFLKGDPLAKKAYHGEYMAQYSWAEDTNAILSEEME